MCHNSCIEFGKMNLREYEIKHKRVLEVGSRDVNGSIRPFVESFEPAEYIGIDINPGLGVDVICDAIDLIERFGFESFDVIISTETLEHIRNWKKAISNIKNVCKIGGIVLITTRSFGFPYHDWPSDFWRFELEDMKEIFSDLQILVLEKDLEEPGVFLKAKKPESFQENNLHSYQLYRVSLPST